MDSTFALWHPIQRESHCWEWDVTRTNIVHLHRGSPELLHAFLSSLGIPATPTAWRIAPLCSPYYAATQPQHWRDRYRMGWRVEVTVADSGQTLPPHHFTPYVVEALDPTWHESEEDWEWTTRPCVVIANFTREAWDNAETVLASDPALAPCQTRTSFPLTPQIIQARLALGPRHFPAEAETVEKVVRVCEAQGGATHWGTSLKLAERLSQANRFEQHRDEIKRLFNYPPSEQ